MTRRADERQLERAGVPRRFRQVAWEAVTVPEIRTPLERWVANLEDYILQGYGMTFFGGYGVGKTCAAVLALDAALGAPGRVDFYVGDGEDRRAHYSPYECHFILATVMSDVLHRPSLPEHRELIAAWQRCDLLVVDDWHKMYLGAEWDRTQLEALFDVRHAECRATIVTINDVNVFKVLPAVRDRFRENSLFVVIDSNTPSRRGAEVALSEVAAGGAS